MEREIRTLCQSGSVNAHILILVKEEDLFRRRGQQGSGDGTLGCQAVRSHHWERPRQGAASVDPYPLDLIVVRGIETMRVGSVIDGGEATMG